MKKKRGKLDAGALLATSLGSCTNYYEVPISIWTRKRFAFCTTAIREVLAGNLCRCNGYNPIQPIYLRNQPIFRGIQVWTGQSEAPHRPTS